MQERRLDPKDPEILLEYFKRAERSQNYDHAIGICFLLVNCGQWKKVQKIGEKWLEVAFCLQQEEENRPQKINEGTQTAAFFSANILRLLAPVSGRFLCPICGASYRPLEKVLCHEQPDPLDFFVFSPLEDYLKAIQIWSPHSWFFSKRPLLWAKNNWSLHLPSDFISTHEKPYMWTIGPDGEPTRVGQDGTIESTGYMCPKLPAIPRKDWMRKQGSASGLQKG